MNPLRRVLGLSRPVRGWMVAAALASFAALASSLGLMTAAPYLISKATLVTGFVAVSLAVTAVRAFALARAAFRYAERYAGHLAALRILTYLRVWLYRAVEPLAPGGLGSFRSGDLLARAVADIDTLDGFLVRGVVPPAAAILGTAVACTILGVLDPSLGLILFAFLALAGLVVPFGARRLSRGPAAASVAARAELHAELTEDVQGLADLLAFGRERRMEERVGRASDAVAMARRRLASGRGVSTGLGAVLAGSAALALLALAVGLVREGRVGGVFLAVVPLLAITAFEAVQPLGDAFEQFEVARPAARRTFEVIDSDPVVRDPRGPRTPPGDRGLAFRDVAFRYGAAEPLVIGDLSFEVPAGGRIGITGPSGSGKTTLVSLLLRFWDASAGAVLLGDVDVRDCRADDVRAVIGVVPQHVFLFNGTLRDNLLVADAEADEARLVQACARAELGDLLATLPEGLDTIVGEDGLTLSGGERQRVALARVFLKEAPILVLDEATSHLDRATEARVLSNLQSFAADRTLLVISHRPAPLQLVDRVLTLPGVERAHR